MRNDQFYQQLVAKMQEVSDLPPQQMGLLTPFYKRMVPHLKFYPWRSIALVSFLLTGALYLLFGIKVIRLASMLQFGF